MPVMGFDWKLALMLFSLLLILLLALARHLMTTEGVSRSNTPVADRAIWDRSFLADFTWFALFECILSFCCRTQSERWNNFPVRLFAGVLALFVLYEFLVPILFPLAATPDSQFPKNIYYE